MPKVEAGYFYLLADKAYDAQEHVLNIFEEKGIKALIPSKSIRLTPRSYEAELYKDRHLIETFFPKHFRVIATRYDKTVCDFLAATHFAATVILLA